MSHQRGSLTAEISGVLERLDRVEESLQGSGKGSPCPDYWTTRPGVTACQFVAPGPSGQPQSSMVMLRENDYTERLCPGTEPLRRSLRLLNKPRPDYRFPGRAGETELSWCPSESRKERECPNTGLQPNRTSRKTRATQQTQRPGIASGKQRGLNPA